MHMRGGCTADDLPLGRNLHMQIALGEPNDPILELGSGRCLTEDAVDFFHWLSDRATHLAPVSDLTAVAMSIGIW